MIQTNQNNLTANAVAVESAIGNRQSAIGNRQSAIGNRQSAIPLLCLIFCAALLTSGSQNATAETSHSVIPAQAGIQTQTQPRHSRAEGAGIQHSRESAPALAGAKAGIQLRVLPLQLLDNRYRDYVGFPPLLRSGENDGKSFSDFYRASQMELFSALDNVLSQKAEDTLNQFAAVKKAEVNFQTSLGNRKGQLGINLIGAFAERQNNAFGWQVRVYGAQQDGKGFNAGVFYRHITDIALFGANAFVDYENHKLGNFYRYSIGGEAQNRYGSFAANYYVPITDEKRKDGGVIFSRKGYDAKLRLNIPNAKFLKAAVDYYNFGDEHGAESDDGFRYGAEAHLIPGLRLGLFYDDGGEELGGEVSYIHTIGEVQQAQTANEQWTPDLFAAVSREHSQRIVSVNVAPQFFAINRMPFIVGVQGAIITVLIPGGGINGSDLPNNFTLINNNSVLLFSATIAGATTQAIIITSAVQTITTSVAITSQNPSPFDADIRYTNSGDRMVHFYNNIQNTVGTIMPSGGSGGYMLSLLPPDVGFALANNAVLFSVATAPHATVTGAEVMATIIADDANQYTDPATIAITARAVSVFSVSVGVRTLSVLAIDTVRMVDLVQVGGLGSLNFQLSQSPTPVGGNPPRITGNRNITWSSDVAAIITITAVVNDDTELTPSYSFTFTATAGS